MLLSLLYHRVGRDKYANPLEILDRHFAWIKEHYPVVLPGDSLAKWHTSLCLTFDDASFDFYHFVYPLLQKYQLRALLGVSTRYILEKSTLNPQERLSVPYVLAMQDGFFDQKAPFCTWEELREMVESGLVQIASHAHMHCNLTFPFVDLHREVVQSKAILEAKLPQSISTFIYPFGKVNDRVHLFVKNHYPFAFRIGSGCNYGWYPKRKPLLRVNADNMASSSSLFQLRKRFGYFLKGFM
ncbi:MAG: polysaccharide deacetylase family protein [Chlamydiales bacterium]